MLIKCCPKLTTYLPLVEIGKRNSFTVISHELLPQAVVRVLVKSAYCLTYLPHLVNIVCGQPLNAGRRYEPRVSSLVYSANTARAILL